MRKSEYRMKKGINPYQIVPNRTATVQSRMTRVR